MTLAEIVQPHDLSNHRRIMNISQFNPAFCDMNLWCKSDVYIKQNLKVIGVLRFPLPCLYGAVIRRNNKFTPALHFWTTLWPIMLTLMTCQYVVFMTPNTTSVLQQMK
jgi:hypothetical protein